MYQTKTIQAFYFKKKLLYELNIHFFFYEVVLKQIFIYSPTHPIDNTELTDAILRTEVADPALSADAADPTLRTDATENADIAPKTLKKDINDIIVM